MPWNALFDFFSQTKKKKKTLYNYKQLSVGVVLLTADYDGPKEHCVPENYTLSPGILNKSKEQLECTGGCLWFLGLGILEGSPKSNDICHATDESGEAFVFKCRRWLNLISYWTSLELFACRLIMPTGFAWKKHQTTLRWF